MCTLQYCILYNIVYSGEEDTRDVYHEVVVLAGSWSNMCLTLGLFPCDLSAIEAAHPRDPHRCLQAVVIKWLQKGYNYQRFGRPSWRTLVKSVADPAGGNNCALGEAIAKNHPGINKYLHACFCLFLWLFSWFCLIAKKVICYQSGSFANITEAFSYGALKHNCYT